MPPPPTDATDILQEAQLLGPLNGPRLHLRFTGPFEGRLVMWDALITVLRESPGASCTGPERNFIEIGDDTPQGITLTVGLDVPCVDSPTVRKVMLMIRQYKRMARGRHEFGSPVVPGPMPPD